MMNTNKSHTTEVSQAELELLEAMRAAPVLTQQVTAILKGFEAETDKGMDACQAELHAVELTRTGQRDRSFGRTAISWQ
ncbi:MAG: hypothetical protein H7A51_14845 [Akkermansiaceae bacterium]|nr:hypothetical protein [Akkermansiaceae bacterium]